MVLKRYAALKLLLIVVVSGFLLQQNGVAASFSNHTTDLSMETADAVARVKRRTQPPQGYFFPIAMYTVRHHRPANERGRDVRPETWEYRGQYFYGYKPKPNTGRRQAARLLAAGLPLLLAPLLSIIFSFPVLVPVAQTTTVTGVTGGTSLLGASPFRPAPWVGRRRRRSRIGGIPNQQDQILRLKAAKLKEYEAVSNYLRQVDYDERQQSRVMVSYLQCNGLLSVEDHCLERLSCEFGDPANMNAPQLERTVTSILLGHILNNEFIPLPFKKRLKSAAVYGRNNSGKCSKYFCPYVDNNWDYTATYPDGSQKTTAVKKSIPPKRPG